ncbi:MAG: 30S ribosomal protein S12 methylthiotransferase RimO [Vicinamibacteria bacterium]|nr:30S ribosomal protein S12 methylthiotransferase RimO [Vicinamibacteria bacterium]
MKVGMISLGCPKNLVDSEVMLGLAEQAGHTLTSDAHEADVLIVNTCAFIDKSKQESIDAILEMAELKKTGACQRLVVTGCLAERYRDELKDQIPEIDALLGTGEVPEIVAALGPGPRTDRGGQAPAVPMTLHRKAPRHQPLGGRAELPTYIYDADTPRRLATPGHYAYVKVAEGCDYTCAFCIIPRLRGHYRSRPAAEIVREAQHLAGRGVKELLLISQDTTFYGNDLGERGALARLLRELNRVDGLEWIRLLYLYPTTIDDTMLEAMAESDKVCKYIDLPLQHASDTVLKRMKRPGTRRSYERLLTNIRTRMPGAALRTTFIVGFPGETEADVAELEGFLDTVRFDHVGIFTYSHEEGTAAGGWDDDVPAATKRKRRDRLMAQQRGIVEAAHQARVGSRVRLVVDGPSPEHELVLRGRLSTQAPDIDPLVYLTECDPSTLSSGQFLEAEVVGARDYDLVARPLL